MNELALFSGAGGGLLASRLLGWTTVCAVEIEQYPRDRVLQRQDEGHLDTFPIWDDIRTFDGRLWRGAIDVISGGFPCQDISAAGKGAGITGERSGLWKEYARIIGEVGPQFVFAENSPLLRTRGLGVVIEDLDRMGYDVRWGVLGAGHLGAIHKRSRLWLVAHSDSERFEKQDVPSIASHEAARQTRDAHQLVAGDWLCKSGSVRQPGRVGLPDDVAGGLVRIRAAGNGQVPLVAATAWSILSEGLL